MLLIIRAAISCLSGFLPLDALGLYVFVPNLKFIEFQITQVLNIDHLISSFIHGMDLYAYLPHP